MVVTPGTRSPNVKEVLGLDADLGTHWEKMGSRRITHEEDDVLRSEQHAHACPRVFAHTQILVSLRCHPKLILAASLALPLLRRAVVSSPSLSREPVCPQSQQIAHLRPQLLSAPLDLRLSSPSTRISSSSIRTKTLSSFTTTEGRHLFYLHSLQH